MYAASITNSRNQTLQLNANEANYQVTEITGLSEPPATVNTTAIYGTVGGVFNSAHVENRNIVINMKINGNAEQNRLNLYKYFPTGEQVRFLYSLDTIQNIYIDGYVDKMECSAFTNKMIAQISIICPYPYFQDTTASTASSVSAVDNSVTIGANSTADCGLTFRVYIIDTLTTLRINQDNGNFLELENISLQSGDVVRINTIDGQKNVVLVRNNAESSLIGSIADGSTFLKIASGGSKFTCTSINAYFNVTYKNTYRGA